MYDKTPKGEENGKAIASHKEFHTKKFWTQQQN